MTSLDSTYLHISSHSTNSSHLSRPDLSQDIRQKLIQKNCLKIVMDPIDPIWSNIIQYDSIWSNMIQYDSIWSNEFLLLWYLWCSFETGIGHRAIDMCSTCTAMYDMYAKRENTSLCILMLYNFVCRSSMIFQHLWLQLVFQPGQYGQCYFMTFSSHVHHQIHQVKSKPSFGLGKGVEVSQAHRGGLLSVFKGWPEVKPCETGNGMEMASHVATHLVN